MDTVTRAPADLSWAGDRLRGLVRGRTADPVWVRPALLAVLVGTAILYVWGLDRSGWANSYYSAAVLAGAQSWKAFFFGALDAGSFITVDKPPAALWLMALSARIFGLSSWSILLPEALLGVGTVALVFAAVRRQRGAAAGVLAAAVMALTPVAVLMFRFNNPDALLTFLLVAAGYALVRALEAGRTRWLLLSAAIVGLAFLTKYLQACIVLPAFVLTFFLLGPGTWLRRFTQLLAAGAALLASSGWWVAIVSAIPAASRPFIGGSTNNTVLDLVFGYDGFGRILGGLGSFGRGAAAGAGRVFSGSGGGPGSGGGFGGAAGPLRLFNEQLGGEISWLLPLAAVAAGVGIWARWGRPRTDQPRAAYVMWGLWLLTHAVVFSFASGILHSYYTVAMAPAVAALVGGGAVELWRRRGRWFPTAPVAAVGIAVTGWWGSQLLARTPDFAPGLGTLEVAIAVVAAIVLLLPRMGGLLGRLPAAALVAAFVAVMLGPTSYALATAGRTQGSGDPRSGPASAAAAFGPGGGQARFGRRFTGAPPAGAQLPGGGPGGFGGGAPIQGGAQPGGFDGGGGTDSALLKYLEQHQGGATWLVAVASANQAAPIELATGRPVLAMGGFSGGDDAMSVDKLIELVRTGQLRYVIVGGGGPGGGTTSVSSWITQHGTKVDYSGTGSSTLYDLSTALGSTSS